MAYVPRRLQHKLAAATATKGRHIAYFAANEPTRREIAGKLERDLEGEGVPFTRHDDRDSIRIDVGAGSIHVRGYGSQNGTLPREVWLNEADL